MIRRAQILFDLRQIFMSFRMKVVTIYSSIIPAYDKKNYLLRLFCLLFCISQRLNTTKMKKFILTLCISLLLIGSIRAHPLCVNGDGPAKVSSNNYS
jgi:hypothetical protein